jgi:uncharacterized protein YecE (DUF72 family)
VAVLIGTSGWQYFHWKGGLYPDGLPHARWLEHYAARFVTVELNNAFYRLPERATFERWASRTPERFVMSVKASRYLTHIRRLRDPAEPVSRLVDRLTGLGQKLGAVLLQLPPNLRCDASALDQTLACFPDSMRLAVELRHESWFTDEIEGVLRRHGAALCLADNKGPVTPIWRTADWGYVRFHQGRAHPEGAYGRAALARWARELAELFTRSATVFAYFNNDGGGCAPRDAVHFAREIARAGLEPSATPPVRETPVR